MPLRPAYPDAGHGPPARRALPLDAAEARATARLIARVRAEVPASLVQASLFGSKARGEARPDSDVDVLLVFARLPPDREPHASHAEAIAAEVAAVTGIPVTVWSVSLVDLAHGERTPMLVDALADSVPLWSRGRILEPVPFTPHDAVRCVRALLDRVREGGEEVGHRLAGGDAGGAARRGRDDVVRLCTAALLLRGFTRPRRGEAVRAYLGMDPGEAGRAGRDPVFAWAGRSFGPDGRDDEAPVPRPPGGMRAVARTVDHLRGVVEREAARLRRRLR